MRFNQIAVALAFVACLSLGSSVMAGETQEGCASDNFCWTECVSGAASCNAFPEVISSETACLSHCESTCASLVTCELSGISVIPSPAVPAVSEWGIATLGLLVALLGTLAIKFRGALSRRA